MLFERYSCPKCYCKILKPILNPGSNKIGLYCTRCGAWVKWTNKDDRKLILIKHEEVIGIE
jgi:hypothetical protein